MMPKLHGLVLVTVCLLAAPYRARAATAEHAQLRRSVVVSVVTRQGRAVNGLSAKCFSARFRGRPVRIESATYDPGPRRVLLLLDTSGSMHDSRLAELTLAKYLLAWIAPQDPIALATFGLKIRDRTPFSPDRTSINGRLKKLLQTPEKPPLGSDYTGKTAIWNALGEALRLFNPHRSGDAIFLLTDAGDNGFHENRKDVIRKCLRTGVRVFVLAVLPPFRLAHLMNEASSGPSEVRELTSRSGGGVAWLSTADLRTLTSHWAIHHRKAVTRAFVEEFAPLALMAREINAVYRLQILLPEPVDKPRRWHLKLVDPKTGKTDRLLLLHYPHQLLPADTPGIATPQP